LFEVDVELEPAELLEAWRPETAQLVLPVGSSPRLRERIVARLRLRGLGRPIALVGWPVRVYDHGAVHLVHLALDESSRGALRRLHASATGARIPIEPRRPRFRACVPVIIEVGAAEVLMNTVTVSIGGLSLAWSGAAPAIGHPLRVWLGDRLPLLVFAGVVCWAAPEDRPTSAGLALVREDPIDQAIWSRFVSNVEAGGALRC
jgi:hypothetical protein